MDWLTLWDIMIAINWDALLDLKLVDGLEDGQSVSNTDDAGFLEVIDHQCNK